MCFHLFSPLCLQRTACIPKSGCAPSSFASAFRYRIPYARTGFLSHSAAAQKAAENGRAAAFEGPDRRRSCAGKELRRIKAENDTVGRRRPRAAGAVRAVKRDGATDCGAVAARRFARVHRFGNAPSRRCPGGRAEKLWVRQRYGSRKEKRDKNRLGESRLRGRRGKLL